MSPSRNPTRTDLPMISTTSPLPVPTPIAVTVAVMLVPAPELELTPVPPIPPPPMLVIPFAFALALEPAFMLFALTIAAALTPGLTTSPTGVAEEEGKVAAADSEA
ncbi:hypothetical protein DEU56DRAFT_919096 [Suillus clintonianus]|uniref:uncharacterized protein n=1 Tax=Suillus clintonianus TaxID=1904413 RepID=UPI001B86A366|nr:uncharacterized protein DEU56DRAFT_919096 [Suillus clintonianus]KAG2116965.1 hypothetical protein DEU56DRAFT_919096 [Suillus clintonianus]